MSDEQNDAERQAEEILEAAYTSARAEDCPQGENCPVHFRVDEEYFDEGLVYARLISYVEDFAVITEDNHAYENPALVLKVLMGKVTKEDLPPRWSTMIFYVGQEVIGDLSEKSVEDRRAALRYCASHDDWNAIAGFHSVTVSALKQGLIDVSEPFHLEGW